MRFLFFQRLSFMHPMTQVAQRSARSVYDYYDLFLDKLDIAKKEGTLHELLDNTANRVEGSLVKQLQRSYPDLEIIDSENQEPVDGWKINPVLGLDNILRGLPNFGLSISVYLQGKLDQVFIANPITNQEYIGAAGRTALLNSKRIRVNSNTNSNPTIALPSLKLNVREKFLPTYMALYTYFLKNNAFVANTGSDAFDVLSVASGYLDAAIIFQPDLQELQPAFLIAREAGCLIGDITGNPKIEADSCLLIANAKYFKHIVKNASPIYQASIF